MNAAYRNRPRRPEPLGILLATDDGLLECLPGAHTARGIDGPRITSVDVRGGLAVAGAPGADGGAWLHAGGSWRSVWQGDVRCVHVGKPGRDGRGDEDGAVYVGTGDGHLLHSTDHGATWSETRSIATIRHDGAVLPPRAILPAVVGVVEVSGGLLVAFDGGGTWFTADVGGDLWFRRSEGLDQRVLRLYEHPDQDARLYATTATGLYRSTDQGDNWVQSLVDLDRGWGGSLAVLPGPRDTLLLSLARSASAQDGALFRSVDGGRAWSRVLLGEEDEWPRVPAVVSPHDWENVIFVAAGSKLYASHDRGTSWMLLDDQLPLTNAIAAAV